MNTLPPGWRAPELGPATEAQLSLGPLRYHRRGSGPVLLFAHGWLANANLWRTVVDRLAADFTCVAADLPLGAHTTPMPDTFRGTPDCIATLLNDLVDTLGADTVTLVGNDSGGAYAQLAAAARPDRIAGLILTACETPYDPFPPDAFTALRDAARTPDGLATLLAPLRDPAVRTSPTAFGRLIKYPVDERVLGSYVLPLLDDPAVRRDASRVFASAAQSYVSAAGERLITHLTAPVLFAWPTQDRFFSLLNVRRYASELRDARIEPIEDSYAFTPEDQPRRLADLISEAARRTAAGNGDRA